MSRQAKWSRLLADSPYLFIRFLLTVLDPLYGPFWRWANRRSARQGEERLARDVRLSLAILFKRYDGRIVPNEGVIFPPYFDYSYITVSMPDMILRFLRGLGEVRVEVASKSTPSEWHDLPLILGILDERSTLERRWYEDLWEVSRVLEPRVESLLELYRSGRFEECKPQLELFYRQEKVAIREFEEELNARLHGSER